MTGDLLLIRTNSWFGKKIRQITNGYYNHIGIFVSDNKIVEATMWGVKLSSLAKFEKQKEAGRIETYDIFKIKGLNSEQKNNIKNFALDTVGYPYDFVQLFSLLYKFIFKKSRNLEPIDVEPAFLCSELVATALDMIGLVIDKNIDKDCITPHDIAISDIVEKI